VFVALPQGASFAPSSTLFDFTSIDSITAPLKTATNLLQDATHSGSKIVSNAVESIGANAQVMKGKLLDYWSKRSTLW